MKVLWAVLLAAALAGCGESGPKALPEGPLEVRIKALSSNVIEVEETVKGEALMITFFKPSILDGKNWTWNLLTTIKDVLPRLDEASRGVPYKRVTFMAEIPTRNNLGQQGKQLAMKLTYQLDQLKGAQWANIYQTDVAELAADVSLRPLGTEAALEYCKDNKDYAKRFCLKVFASALPPSLR